MPAQSSNSPIETVFLDAGGVLVFPNWDRVASTLAAHGIDASADSLRRAEPTVKFAIDNDTYIATTSDAQRGGDLFNGVLDRAGVGPSPAREAALSELYAYHMEHNLWEEVAPDATVTLARLRTLGLRLAIVSNANGVVHKAFERAGLHDYFDTICDSSVEGVEKPDPRFFEIVLERTGSRAATTVHVGDLYHVDVVGARRAGLRAMLIDPHDLYSAFDVERVRSLTELADVIASRLT